MVWEFSVAYAFQILSAVLILLVGLKGAAWVGGETKHLCETKNMDVTLAGFIGIGRYRFHHHPGKIRHCHCAVDCAGGRTSLWRKGCNSGAPVKLRRGVSIILTRPFVVGNTVIMRGASGVVK
jgi:small conductance mechanosensitive channel